MSFEILIAIGLLAGTVTTAVGVGGGMLMVVCLSFFLDIQTVLILTAPALLVGNFGRMWMLRGSIHKRTAAAILIGSIPGVLVGALVLIMVREEVLRAGLACAALIYVALNVAKELRVRQTKHGERMGYPALAGAGVACGMVAASVGGGGLVLAPALTRTRLERDAFVATAATVATGLHFGRFVGYGALGLSSGSVWIGASILGGAILVGNSLGARVLSRASARTFRLGLLAVLTLMAAVLIFC